MRSDTRALLGKAGAVRLSDARVKVGDRICNYCAAESFCQTEAMQTCPGFIAPLVFREPLVGFEDEFSTVRLGLAWTKRLKVGALVALVQVPELKTFGYATVERIESGTLKQMLKRHGHTNHTMLDKPKKKAPALLNEVVISMYGKNWSAPTRTATTIFLRRVTDKQAGAIEKTWPAHL